METNKIYHGHVLDILKTFPDGCIDCCITSPPYYGLRAYDVPPVIWDGDLFLLCTSCLCILRIDKKTQTIKEVIKNGTEETLVRKELEMFNMRKNSNSLLRREKAQQIRQGGLGKRQKNTPGKGLLQEPQYKNSSNGRTDKTSESQTQHGGKQYKLEGRKEGTGIRLYLHSCPTGTSNSGKKEREKEIYSGTQIYNGEASWTLFGGLGKGSSQERNKERQQNREFGAGKYENTSWGGSMPPLSSAVYDTLKCNSCGNNEFIKIECCHEWGCEFKGDTRECYVGDNAPRWAHNPHPDGKIPKHIKVSQGQFCSLCGAWRGSLGLEPDYRLYIAHLIQIFNEVYRVLKKTGTCWVNVGDTYGGMKQGNDDLKNPNVNTKSFKKSAGQSKSLIQIPERFSIAMTDAGWIKRNTVIWHKPNCMPSSAKDRFTVDFEYVYFFVKNKKYYFEQQFEPYTEPLDRWGGQELKADGISTWDNGTGQASYRDRDMRPNEQGRNKRTVWKGKEKLFRLRDDLTPKQRRFVLKRLYGGEGHF